MKDIHKTCPFCLGDKHPRNRILKETKYSICLLSNPRLVKGHALVTPKRHIEYPGDLTRDELADIFKNIEWIRSKLLAGKLGTGVDIRQNYRPFLPQSRLKLDHVHFHVLPRTFQDEIYHRAMHRETELFEDLDDEECKEVRDVLSGED
jgi:diadenosine tetraphosphate (Ap4A) HIT family hydrolase